VTTTDVVASRPWAVALVVATRPKQWVKNALVFAAPLAGGVLTNGEVFGYAVTACAVFVLASAGCYLLNDVYDVDRDRQHPHKRLRPVASGQLGTAAATAVAAVLLVTAVAVSLTVDREMLTVVVLTYVGLVIGYSGGVKEVPGLELLVLAAGFVLRALAGSAATGVRPSNWFLAVCCLAALTIALGKRQVELADLGRAAGLHRAALAHYSTAMLRRARLLAVAGTVGAYASWALTRSGTYDRALALATLVPVVAALVRLGRLNDQGEGGAPELVLYRDRFMQVCCAGWLVLFLLGPGHV
jgi:decaprenyl-phosphate phosphoribosyltransferase